MNYFLISCMPSPLSLIALTGKLFKRFADPGFPEVALVKLAAYVHDVPVFFYHKQG